MVLQADKARPANATKNCASATMGSPPTFNRGFVIKQATSDPHVETMDTDGTKTTPTGMVTTAKTLDFSSFFYANTPKAGQHSVARIPPSTGG